MNVLSLFDGMSCGQQALERSGILVDNYFSSEIDKHAIAVTMHNYPNTKQLGSVIDLNGYTLPKIDLLIGGSPCQSFSFAGKRKGMSTKCETEILTLDQYLELKNEGYEFEGQSYLFWEYMRLMTEVKPTYFLLENVIMVKKWKDILSKAIGVEPIEINSALVSAQNRRRLYWTNIGTVPHPFFDTKMSIIKQPKDKNILLKDILEDNVDEKYFITGAMLNRIKRTNNGERCFDDTNKSLCLTSGYYKQGRDNQLIVHNTMPRSGDPKKGGTGPLSRSDGKTYCLDTGNTNAIEIVCAAMRGRNPENPKSRGSGIPTEQMLEFRQDNKTNCLTSVQKDNLVIQVNSSTERNGKSPFEHNRVFLTDARSPAIVVENKKLPSGIIIGDGYRQDNIAHLEDGKSGCLDTIPNRQKVIFEKSRLIRRLTPTECERLQTVNDGYTSVASTSQRYRMLGNGWTVDVISHIFGYLPK